MTESKRRAPPYVFSPLFYDGRLSYLSASRLKRGLRSRPRPSETPRRTTAAVTLRHSAVVVYYQRMSPRMTFVNETPSMRL